MLKFYFLFLFFLAPSLFAEEGEYYPSEEEIDQYNQFAEQNEVNDGNFGRKRPSMWKDKDTPSALLPFTLTTEVLGRTGLFSINTDYSFLNYFAAGVGIVLLVQRKGTKDITSFIAPIYLNGYLSKGEHRPFLTIGSNYTKVSIKDLTVPEEAEGKVTISGFYPTYGAGYEMRLKIGFVFRLALYKTVVLGMKNTMMVGLSFGGGFHLNKFGTGRDEDLKN